jgi:hypothetical protein
MDSAVMLHDWSMQQAPGSRSSSVRCSLFKAVHATIDCCSVDKCVRQSFVE